MASIARLLERRSGVPDGVLDAVLEPESGEQFVPLANWQGEPRVLLGPADEAAALEGSFGEIEAIAIDFPHFTDGRGYSIARLLRERHTFRGELRAVGDVSRDNLFYLARCGFDSFLLKDEAGAQEALLGLADFSEAYQASVERPQPLFRRRLV